MFKFFVFKSNMIKSLKKQKIAVNFNSQCHKNMITAEVN